MSDKMSALPKFTKHFSNSIRLFQSKSAVFILALALSIACFAGGDVALARGDTSANAVVNGGVFSSAEAKAAIKQKDVSALYSQYSINTSASMHEGTVTKDGRVLVDGKVVATGAQTVGRQKLGGDKAFTAGGTTFYERPTQTSMNSSELPAFVITDVNGKFVSAIIKDCGNPVKGTPVVTPKTIYTCDALTATPVSSEGSTTKYQFTVKGSASNGAKITGYSFGTGDGYGTKSETPSVTYDYKKPGNYVAEASVIVDVNGKSQQVSSEKCRANIKIAQPVVEKIKACDTTSKQIVELDKNTNLGTRYTTDLTKCQAAPVKEYLTVCELSTKKIIQIEKSAYDSTKHSTDQSNCAAKETPVALPATGPAELFTGGLGAASIAGATYYYRGSKREVLKKWLNR